MKQALALRLASGGFLIRKQSVVAPALTGSYVPKPVTRDIRDFPRIPGFHSRARIGPSLKGRLWGKGQCSTRATRLAGFNAVVERLRQRARSFRSCWAFRSPAAVTQHTPCLVSALLPTSRSAVVGTTVTAFATVINAGELATDCSITPTTPVAADFFYQTTDPATNALDRQHPTHRWIWQLERCRALLSGSPRPRRLPPPKWRLPLTAPIPSPRPAPWDSTPCCFPPRPRGCRTSSRWPPLRQWGRGGGARAQEWCWRVCGGHGQCGHHGLDHRLDRHRSDRPAGDTAAV